MSWFPQRIEQRFAVWWAGRVLGLILFLSLSNILLCNPSALAATRPRYLPEHGAPILNPNAAGEVWQAALPESRIAFCNEANAAFRGSPSQSYIISWNVQSLNPAGLCDRIDQYYAQEENLDTRISAAAAIAPLLYADIPIEVSNYE